VPPRIILRPERQAKEGAHVTSNLSPVYECPELSIIMPAYNEEETVVEAVKRALDAGLPAGALEVVVVNNGSVDRTGERLREEAWPPSVKIVELSPNRGKGGAVRAGVEHASGEVVAVLDADLEYDARDLAQMLPKIRESGADAVIGSRYWQAHTAYGYWYVMGNKMINTICNALYNTYISDFASCLKMLPADLFRSLDLKEDGFGFDAEIVAKLLRRRSRVFEVPISYMARTRDEGKKIGMIDGARMLWVFVKCRLS
jgi:dolichol-phosphate hexosyltransferase